jgi:hypothetical protein
MTIDEKINILNSEISLLNKIKEKYPDITVSKNRWGDEEYHADLSSKNSLSVTTRHSCGCCSDAYVDLAFYDVIGDKKIWHKTQYYISRANLCYDLRLHENIKKTLEADGFSEYIAIAEKYLEETYHPEYDGYDDEDDVDD